MAQFLVVGALAWDVPIWLKGEFWSGARVRASSLDGQMGGRLGGGGANAACALQGAGHNAPVMAILSSDAQGRKVAAAARTYGLSLDLVSALDFPSSTTLIFVHPTGERSIVALDSTGWINRRDAVARALPDQLRIDHLQPEGVYVRSYYPGLEQLSFENSRVVMHWPVFTDHTIDADVLVSSRDDLDVDSAEALYEQVQGQASNRLKWVVLTQGAGPVSAFNGESRIDFQPGRVAQVDATGAGDIFAAGLLDALVAGASMAEALGHASNWGGIAVGLEGSAPAPHQQSRFRPFFRPFADSQLTA